MGAPLIYDFKGLVTAPGRLARSEASCVDALNVVFDAPGVVRKRRGWRKLTALASGIPWKAFSSSTWGSNVVLAKGLTAGSTGLIYGDGTALWTGISPPDGAAIRDTPAQRIMGAQSLRSFYLAALDSPVRLEPDSPASTIARYAGMPRGLPGGRGSALVSGTLLPDGYARAFRVTWHRYDSDGVLLSGPPTGRFVVRNQPGTAGYSAGSARDVSSYFYVPVEWGTDATPITQLYFWRLWASRTFNAGGGELGDDEMYLVAERFVTNAEIAAGNVAFTDSTPNDFLQRQQALNTNAIDFPPGELGKTQGIINADEPPPIAYEVATWANVTWWADIRYRPQGKLTFLSVGAPNGLQDGDTIRFQIGATGLTLRAKLVPSLGSDFTLFTGLGTVQMNLEATAQSFAEVFNVNAKAFSVGMRAYTVGLPTSQGGAVVVEACRIDSTAAGLQFVPSRTTWYQYDPSAAGVNVGFGSEARNAVAYSKRERADAVPLINRFAAGPNNARIIRVQPFRDRLFFFTDQGVYSITGRSFDDFSMTEFALELRLLAREAVAVCDDAVYAWCTQGIAKITDGGWEIISTPIEPTVQAIVQSAVDPSGVAKLAYAIGDSDQHRVVFWYPLQQATPSGVNGCAAALVLDTRTNAWSRYQFIGANARTDPDPKAHGCVRFSDKRVLLTSQHDLNDSEGYLYEERRDFIATDFTDDDSTGNNKAVQSSVQLQFMVPEAQGAQHWQQTVLHFDGLEQSWRPLPSGIVVFYATETQTGTSGFIVPSKKFLRVTPPRDVRRANQLSVRIVDQQSAYFGLVGLQQRYLEGSIFATRTR